jgi:hypothetical protein
MRTSHFTAFALLAVSLRVTAQTRADGQHDFDFEIGRWRAHLERLSKPFVHSTTWISYDGTSVVNPVWGGLANLGELEVDGSGTHIEGLSFRVYDPQARQWRIHWANSNDGALGPAMVGGFANGRGEFYDQEDLAGRPIFVRFIFSGISTTSFKLEQAFSEDAGKTWETNWISTFLKDTTPAGATRGAASGQDFAFENGTWSMQRRSLKDPFGTNTWSESSGSTHIVRAVWNGRAALGELVGAGERATFAGSLLRTYDPQAKRWNLYWIDRESGRVSAPLIGELKSGRATFFGQQDIRGVTVLSRVVYDHVTPTSFRTEQAWSLDGGGTWTVYAMDTFTRKSP